MEFHGTTALVTGASSGIGEAFARSLAARGARIVLLARRTELLDEIAATLPAAAAGAHEVISIDLTALDAIARILKELENRNITVDTLVNNAGFATHGAFGDADARRLEDEVTVNVARVVGLTRALLPGMLERDRGAVINIASTAAFQPLPFMAVYGATKAFVLSFTEALWGETATTGVRVLAVCPGATETEFFAVAGEGASVGSRQTPDQVVATAFRALGRRRPSVVSGRTNTASTLLPRLLPRATTIRFTRRLLAPTR